MLVGSQRAASDAVIGLWVRAAHGVLTEQDLGFLEGQVMPLEDVVWASTVVLVAGKSLANQIYETHVLGSLFSGTQWRLCYPSITTWHPPEPARKGKELVEETLQPLLDRVTLVACEQLSNGHSHGSSVLLVHNYR